MCGHPSQFFSLRLFGWVLTKSLSITVPFFHKWNICQIENYLVISTQRHFQFSKKGTGSQTVKLKPEQKIRPKMNGLPWITPFEPSETSKLLWHHLLVKRHQPEVETSLVFKKKTGMLPFGLKLFLVDNCLSCYLPIVKKVHNDLVLLWCAILDLSVWTLKTFRSF